MRNQPPEFANVVLDSLTAHIAVLDEQGLIIGVNDPWRRFSDRNQGAAPNYYVGQNYLRACENAAQRGDATAAALLDGIHSVLAGRCSRFSLEYPCHSPDEERWFIVWVTACQQRGESRLVVAHEDITARKKAELALERAEHRLRSMLDALPVGVWLIDRAGDIQQSNDAGHRIWRVDAATAPSNIRDYPGHRLDDGGRIAPDESAAMRAIVNGESTIDDSVAIEDFQGGHKIILSSAVPLREYGLGVSGAILVQQDITARHQAEAQLRQAKQALEKANLDLQQSLQREQLAARTDALTGLFNRRYFFDLAGKLFAVSKRYASPMAVVMLDVDHFKRINDDYGHQAGDVALRHIADCAIKNTRAADVLARYGGEELILLLPESGVQQGLEAAESIRKAVAAAPLEIGGHAVTLALSAGIAAFSPEDESIEAMIRRADQALYQAKSAGRNCCRIA